MCWRSAGLSKWEDAALFSPHPAYSSAYIRQERSCGEVEEYDDVAQNWYLKIWILGRITPKKILVRKIERILIGTTTQKFLINFRHCFLGKARQNVLYNTNHCDTDDIVQITFEQYIEYYFTPPIFDIIWYPRTNNVISPDGGKFMTLLHTLPNCDWLLMNAYRSLTQRIAKSSALTADHWKWREKPLLLIWKWR